MATRGKAAACAAHRKAQAKYVAKNPGAQRKRSAEAYKKNKTAIKADKKQARKASSKPSGKKTGAKPSGRPKTC